MSTDVFFMSDVDIFKMISFNDVYMAITVQLISGNDRKIMLKAYKNMHVYDGLLLFSSVRKEHTNS